MADQLRIARVADAIAKVNLGELGDVTGKERTHRAMDCVMAAMMIAVAAADGLGVTLPQLESMVRAAWEHARKGARGG